MKISLLAPAAALAMIAAPTFAASTTTTTVTKSKPAKHAKAHVAKKTVTTSTSK